MEYELFGKPSNDPKGVSKIAWKKFVNSFQLPSNHTTNTRDFLNLIGLPKPFPKIAEHFIKIGMELEIQIACYPANSLTRQWNANTGVWGYNTEWFTPFHSSYTNSFDTSRLVAELMRHRGGALYNVAHETAHVMFSEIGLRGLFGTSKKGDLERDLSSTHLFGEMFAEYASHYELPLDTYKYWQKHWSPISETSEGQASNAGKAAYDLGLRSPKARAIMMYSSYYNTDENPIVINARKTAESPLLTAAFLMQRSYGEKSAKAVKNWWSNYWGHASMQEYIEKYIPKRPALVWLKGKKNPLEISTLDDLSSRFDEIFYKWSPPPSKLVNFYSVRRKVQRQAMIVCQLIRLSEYEGLRVSSSDKKYLKDEILNSNNKLFEIYNSISKFSETAMKRDEFAKLSEKIDVVMETLVGNLNKKCPKGVLFSHPSTLGLDMSDKPELNDLRDIFKVNWPTETKPQVDMLISFERIFSRLSSDTTSLISEHLAGPEQIDISLKLALFANEAFLIRTSNNLSLGKAYIQRAKDWVGASTKSGSLLLGYKWSWIKDLPFIDPLVGYRVS